MKIMSILKTVSGVTTAIVGSVVAFRASKALKAEDTADGNECTMPSMPSIEDDIKDDIESEEEEEKEEET